MLGAYMKGIVLIAAGGEPGALQPAQRRRHAGTVRHRADLADDAAGAIAGRTTSKGNSDA